MLGMLSWIVHLKTLPDRADSPGVVVGTESCWVGGPQEQTPIPQGGAGQSLGGELMDWEGEPPWTLSSWLLNGKQGVYVACLLTPCIMTGVHRPTDWMTKP